MNPVIGFLDERPRLGHLLALASGALLTLAFAPYEWRPLAILSPALLFVLWWGQTPGWAALRGYLYGLGMFGAGVHWIYHSLYLFGSAIAPLAALITALFVAFLALYPALLGYLLARFSPRTAGLALVIVFPAAWVLFEWWRGWFLTGFPWLLLGTSQVDTGLAGYVPVLGAFGASLIVALMAGVLAWMIVRASPRVVAGGLAGLALAWAVGLALTRVEWTEPDGAPLTVSLLQGAVDQREKWGPEAVDDALTLYGGLTRQALGSDIVLWPETAIPAFYHEVYEPLLELAQEVEAAGGSMVTGIFVYDFESRNMYNSIVHVSEQPAAYHKRHLVPFGEYMPLRGLLRWLDAYLEIPMSDLSSGSGRPLLDVGGITMGTTVCYEDAFGGQAIEALPEAQLLLNVSNDAWFGDSIAPHQHMEIARMRSLESGRDMLRATNTGVSAVIGHRGELIATSPQFEAHVLTTQAQPRAGVTPFARWGNNAAILLTLILLAGGWLAGRRGSAADSN
ncbi:apolipoprotein N-acyltransferase [Thioalkalivibrio denitrificans]|uniref:Apolipoprotein N-acyltransferase n=1 Tax=Thioalkalivibrio denitrificans TaxID=108003 RepID=A0A1V3NCQ5_9GAMM|nr:apolipoprotein N-acyltransferase [Thioalkalivibrio denitrificans]OOG22850.1 apolipoprotein N-acyltransferase [Thioalkalivibrio denitrificans]